MKKHYPYLKDIQFLDCLYGQHNKTTYTKITILDWWERPIQEVQGKVLSASISVNGDSAVRRTANLQVKIDDTEDTYKNINSLFAINKKVFIETGLKNTLRHVYPLYSDYDTIWFPFGTFVISSCSMNHDSSGVTASLNLNDKMGLLNGTSGGVIPASTNFESYDTLGPDGDLHTEYLQINRIIPELVNHFGGEDLNNIIVNDIPDRIKQVLRWVGGNPLFLYGNTDNPRNNFYTTIKAYDGDEYPTGYNLKQKFTYNYDCGYTYTPFVYPGELVAAPGDNVCTILDKIKSTLGNYEYYYDVFGNFIFQEIKNYVNTTNWRTAFNEWEKGKDIELPYSYNRVLNDAVYDFSKNNFVLSYSNSPQYEMIKNDFVVWGTRKSLDNNQAFPCRYHLAIDERPRIDSPWSITEALTEGICFDTSVNDKIRRAYPIEKGYETLDALKAELPEGIVGKYYLIGTGQNKEVYSWVTDVQKYKNDLNNMTSAAENTEQVTSSQSTVEAVAGYVKLELATWFKGDTPFVVQPTTDWRNILYWKGVIASKTGTDTGYYWAELCNEWPKLYDVENDEYYPEKVQYPSSFDWWLDIIDSDAYLNNFSVNNIGRRCYAKNESGCNCVFEPDIPNIYMVNVEGEGLPDSRSQMTIDELRELGLIPIQVNSSIMNSTATGGLLNSCYENIRQLIQDYIDYNESINVTCLPIYHLEPNTLVHFDDPESGIYGDYLINTISYTLGNNGTMNISAKKINQKM